VIINPNGGHTKQEIEQMVMSRNRSTLGRRSGNIIDLYISKGQIIARYWPVDQIFEPSESYQRAQQMTTIERRIEKYMGDSDRMAYRLRAVRSRYNWWEVLGKSCLSMAYNTPDLPCGFRLRDMAYNSKYIFIRFYLEATKWFKAKFYHADEIHGAGHNWLMGRHREAGLENQLPGIEVDNPYYELMSSSWSYQYGYATLQVSRQYVKVGDYFAICPMMRGVKMLESNMSGLYKITTDKPWWLNAPLSPART